MSNYINISNCVIEGNENGVVTEVNSAVSAGNAPLEIINEGLLSGMNAVGDKFASGEMFVPEVLMSARAMAAGMDIVKPMLADGESTSLGTVVIGTVKGDLHDIGKNLVVMMLESAGFNVINLGVDVTPEAFVKAAKENDADIVGMSAMLTTTMTVMQDTIDACKAEGIDAQFMIGGAPVTPIYAEKINAIYTADASTAAERAKAMV